MQEIQHTIITSALAVLCALPVPTLAADALTATTPRGATLQVLVDLPAGTGPFPAIVLAPGQGYHMALPALLAWRAFTADAALRGGLFLTPVCSHIPKGQSTPVEVADENYPNITQERRPMAFIAGDRDPLCTPAALYRLAAKAGTTARVAIVGGDHGFGNRSLAGDAAARAESRNVSAVARLAANFVTEVSGQ